MTNTPSQEEIERAAKRFEEWNVSSDAFRHTNELRYEWEARKLAAYAQSERARQREADARVAAKHGHYHQGYKIAEEIREGEGKGEL